jgi:biopolymer transport protein ExbD
MAVNIGERRRLKETDLTPLIDVVFLLLIFFLFTSSYVFKTFDLRLPAKAKVRPTATENLPPVTITLHEGGEILFDGIPVDVKDLRRNVYAHIPADGKRTFVVRAEDKVSVQVMVSVMDEIRGGGATDVRIARQPQASG